MKTFASFLEKFKNIKNPKEDRINIAKIISDTAGIKINESQISVIKNILSIKSDNYIKTEIFMKKEKILESLNKNKFYIKDIR